MELAHDTSTENNIVLYKEPHTDNDDNELKELYIDEKYESESESGVKKVIVLDPVPYIDEESGEEIYRKHEFTVLVSNYSRAECVITFFIRVSYYGMIVGYTLVLYHYIIPYHLDPLLVSLRIPIILFSYILYMLVNAFVLIKIKYD